MNLILWIVYRFKVYVKNGVSEKVEMDGFFFWFVKLDVIIFELG